MTRKRIIGLFQTEIDVIRKIEEWQVHSSQADQQLYAITKDADFYVNLQNLSGAKVTSAKPSIIEKAKSLLTKNQPTKDYLVDFGLSEKEADAYQQEIENGLILLVADELPQKKERI
ncbi:general stress protein [Bacillus xiapuensis]|uniref:general stress protein n=1 Tax=Bacillus xiapuensis TaxID=2014075 RepID=UPI000C240AD5|nr:general stress protein [Bacillus xiapuensis]